MALGLVGVHPHWYRWSSTTTGAAGCGRVNGHVWELQGIVAELVAQEVDGGEVTVTRDRGVQCGLVGASMPILASSL